MRLGQVQPLTLGRGLSRSGKGVLRPARVSASGGSVLCAWEPERSEGGAVLPGNLCSPYERYANNTITCVQYNNQQEDRSPESSN